MSEVCDSLSRVKWNNRSAFYNCLRWARYHYLSVKLKKYFPKRVQIVRYDVLCANSDRVIHKLSNSLGLFQTSQNVEGFRNFDEGFEPWKIRSAQPPQVKRKKFRLSRLSVELINIFELCSITCKNYFQI